MDDTPVAATRPSKDTKRQIEALSGRGFKVAEIAKVLGVTPQAVYWHLRQGSGHEHVSEVSGVSEPSQAQ